MMQFGTRAILGQNVGHIRVTDLLGEGGMGAVYVGYDGTLERKVALKAIRGDYRLNRESSWTTSPCRLIRSHRKRHRFDLGRK